MLNTPVLFIVFNRPETTKQVFEAIRKAKPKQLFVAADGPRINKSGEKEKCEQVKKIATAVDWPCEVNILFSDENLGCGRGPAKAITWFFENVEQGIILEDDCLPDPTFFSFCQTLLEFYKDDERIMHIGGNCFYPNNYKHSYYFSSYTHIWGWASWRRAWKKYNFDLYNLESQALYSQIKKLFLTTAESNFWINHYNNVVRMDYKDFWDYQWCITVWYYKGMSILPHKNLVKNIGFGEDATHTLDNSSPLAKMQAYSIEHVIHNHDVQLDKEADLYTSTNIFYIKSKRKILLQKIKNTASAILKK